MSTGLTSVVNARKRRVLWEACLVLCFRERCSLTADIQMNHTTAASRMRGSLTATASGTPIVKMEKNAIMTVQYSQSVNQMYGREEVKELCGDRVD